MRAEGREKGAELEAEADRAGSQRAGGGAGWGERVRGGALRVTPARPLPLSPVMWGGFISPGAAGSVTDLIKLFSIKKLPRHSSTSASRAPAGIKC